MKTERNEIILKTPKWWKGNEETEKRDTIKDLDDTPSNKFIDKFLPEESDSSMEMVVLNMLIVDDSKQGGLNA